jgi:hypothetical protein
MKTSDEMELMIDALDLLGRLGYAQLVTITALMQRMLPPRAGRAWQATRIQLHVARVRQAGGPDADRLAALLNVIDDWMIAD